MTNVGVFDVNASFPADPLQRSVVEALARQAAECAGCAPDVVAAFAEEVGSAFVTGAEETRTGGEVGLRVERSPEAIEVVVSAAGTRRVRRPAPLVAAR
jgi:hypothetical protein